MDLVLIKGIPNIIRCICGIHTKKSAIIGEIGQRVKIANERIIDIVGKWPEYAKETGVDKHRIEVVRKTHRLKLDGIG